MKAFRYTVALLFTLIILYSKAGLFIEARIVTQQQAAFANCPKIILLNVSTVSPTCGNSDGSITGVQVNSDGTKITYNWLNAQNISVGKSLDLTGVPAGDYQLSVSDNSGCNTTVLSRKITLVNSNAIEVYTVDAVTKKSTCNNDGAITGIRTRNVSSFSWYNFDTGKTYVSYTSPDLINVPPGTYKLTASNGAGACDVQTGPMVVESTIPIPAIASYYIVQPACNSTSGDTIAVTLSVRKGQKQMKFFFANSKGDHIKDGLLLTDVVSPTLKAYDLRPGTYSLNIEDENKCSVVLGTYIIKEATLSIYPDSSTYFHDKCDQSLGAITPYIVGGTAPPPRSQFIWTDFKTQKVVSNFKGLFRVRAGQYQLTVTDPSGCVTTALFTMINDDVTLIPPIASGTTLCLPGVVSINVTNIDTTGIFKLYANENDMVPIDSNANGVFYRHVDETTDFYLSRSHGSCESIRTKVTEVVVADIKFGNTFSPNNDGVNDYWAIKGLEKFPGAVISVFNRNGQLVYHSVNYAVPFDGRYRGASLPRGVYYYVMDVKQPICFGKISGSLTILR